MVITCVGISVFNVVDLLNQNCVRETFTFAAHHDTGYLQRDNVVVAAVPEPGTIGLIVPGMIAIPAALGMWRKRSTA